MKRITLTCPFTGLPFEATEFADGTIVFIHPLTGKEIRMNWNCSCKRYMLQKDDFAHIEVMNSKDAVNELDVTNQRINILCQKGILTSAIVNGQRIITKDSVILYKDGRKHGRPRKDD